MKGFFFSRAGALFALALILAACWEVAGADKALPPAKWSAEAFLDRVRNARTGRSWALLKGTARHSRRGSRSISSPLEMGIFFTPVRTLAQIRFGGLHEIYTIGQSYGKSGATSVKTFLSPGFKAQIGVYGITPEELALSFLYWNYKKEYERDSVRGQSCRVFLLENKDRTQLAKVYISADYLFPLRAEFSTVSQAGKVFKTLEAAAFKQENGYYFVSRIILRGDSWNTQIRFDDLKAGPFEKKLPPGVFTGSLF